MRLRVRAVLSANSRAATTSNRQGLLPGRCSTRRARRRAPTAATVQWTGPSAASNDYNPLTVILPASLLALPTTTNALQCPSPPNAQGGILAGGWFQHNWGHPYAELYTGRGTSGGVGCMLLADGSTFGRWPLTECCPGVGGREGVLLGG